MDPRPRGVVGVVRGTFQSFSEDKAPRMAAALSYYTVFSLAPLLVLVIAITGFIIGSNGQVRSQVLGEVRALVGAQGAEMVDTLITNANRPREGILATLIGIITLIVGATGVFVQLKDALNTIWEVTRREGIRGMAKERLYGFMMILGLGFLLLVSLVISAALAVLNEYFTNLLGDSWVVSMLINYGVQLVVITIIFGAIFRGVPDVVVGWRDVWVGAMVTAILFLAGQYLISLYLSSASPASTYGAAGSLMVLLLWVYYSSMILFLGAEFTKVMVYARGGQVVPKGNARRLEAVERIHQGIARPRDEAAAMQPAAVAQPTAVSQPVEPARPEAVRQPELVEKPAAARQPAAQERRGARSYPAGQGASIPVSGQESRRDEDEEQGSGI